MASRQQKQKGVAVLFASTAPFFQTGSLLSHAEAVDTRPDAEYAVPSSVPRLSILHCATSSPLQTRLPAGVGT